MARKQVKRCVVCGHELVGVHGRTLTCSQLCRHERDRIYIREYLRKRYHNDPAYRERRLAILHERYHNDPAYRERHLAYGHEYRSDPAYLVKQRERYRNDPIYQKRRRERRRERMSDPAYRERYNVGKRKRARKQAIKEKAILDAFRELGWMDYLNETTSQDVTT